MKHFFRSVKYVLPHKGRLIASLVCVLAISVLWVSGLAALLPGMKILLSEEGLHGWADQTMVDDRLDIGTINNKLSQPIEGLAEVVQVVDVDEDSPLARLGVKEGAWIVGLDGQRMRYEQLMQTLADRQGDQPWLLDTYDSLQKQAGQVKVVPEAPGPQSRLLHWVSRKVDRPQTDRDRFDQLVGLLVLGLVLTVLQGMARFGQEYLVQSAILEGLADLRIETYTTVLHLPVGYFASRGTTDTMSRFVQDTGEISRGLGTLLGKTLVEPAKLVTTFGLALYLDWKLTLLACVAGPPAFYLIRRLGKLMKKATRKALQGWSDMLAVLEETLVGIRVVKGYTMEPAEQERFGAVNRRLFKQQRRMEGVEAATSPAIEILGVAAALAIAAAAGYRVLVGRPEGDAWYAFFFEPKMDREEFLTLMAALFAVFDPVRKLSQVSTRFHRADAAAGRVFELRDQLVEHDPAGAPELPRHNRSIEFRDLSFTYPEARTQALRDVNLKINQGESVAIVGSNGSGKTTLLSMVPRFFTPQAGQVLVDGLDVSGVTLRSLRGQIGIVTQETVIFHATIAENIAYGLKDPSREAVLSAARQAFVDDFVRQLPQGYDTKVGEHGATLSGGQRQRIAIARAILRDPAILIFDEAMSQIDSESEAKIHQALEQFMAGRTTLMIAHRFSTVIGADRVVVMADGQIVDMGKHEELLKRCPTYRTLFETQLVGSA